MTPSQMFSSFGKDEEIRFVTGDNVETPAGLAKVISKFTRGLQWWYETSKGTYTAETINRLNPKT